MNAVSAQPPVVTRFAPSPTGFLHIGGARTALFNWLFARAQGGTFLLRIEDTDRARSTQPAIDAILDGMQWLGLDWDGEVTYQFSRAARHAEVAHQLLAAGHAYKCFATAEELTAMREAQQAAKQPARYDGRWRDRDPAEAAPGAPFVIRLKAPREGAMTIQDRVQGDVTVQNAELDDLVLLRSDGTPTYMLAVVVDDHDMGVTHVIRGDDHLNNAFRQIPIMQAMDAIEGGWPVPVYAHIPLIHGTDGAKMSKRHGAVGVDAYRDTLGILPEALDNYLLRLGWGHGDDEIISRAQAIDWFDLSGVGKSPSRFDLKKLENLNGHYIRLADDDRLARLVADRIGGDIGAAEYDLLRRSMPFLKPRAANLLELADGAGFLFRERPLAMDSDAAALLAGAAPALLAQIHAALDALN
ncbi:MAG: glutamate--tRNA ligase, partial [Sphingomonas sp.]|nr:glutamate--tRNA ligase [Sphingomonas sp.]